MLSSSTICALCIYITLWISVPCLSYSHHRFVGHLLVCCTLCTSNDMWSLCLLQFMLETIRRCETRYIQAQQTFFGRIHISIRRYFRWKYEIMLAPVSASVMYYEKFSMLVSQWFSFVFSFWKWCWVREKRARTASTKNIHASIRRAPLCYDDFVKNSKGRSKSVRFVSLHLLFCCAAGCVVHCFVHAALVWVNSKRKKRSGSKRVKHSSEWVNECWYVRFLWLLYFSLISCPFSILHLSKWWW